MGPLGSVDPSVRHPVRAAVDRRRRSGQYPTSASAWRRHNNARAPSNSRSSALSSALVAGSAAAGARAAYAFWYPQKSSVRHSLAARTLWKYAMRDSVGLKPRRGLGAIPVSCCAVARSVTSYSGGQPLSGMLAGFLRGWQSTRAQPFVLRRLAASPWAEGESRYEPGSRR